MGDKFLNSRIRNMIGHSAVVIFIALLAGWGLAMSLIGGFEIFPGYILPLRYLETRQHGRELTQEGF